MFDWVLNTPLSLADIGRKNLPLKKNSLTLIWKRQKKFAIVFRGVFRTQ